MATSEFTPIRRRPRTATSGRLYADMATELRRRIAEGIYPSGSKIPGLRELVEEFSVSTITVRRALQELTSEGILFGRQGRGVFVKPRHKIHRVLAGDPDNSFGDEIRRAGFHPHFQEQDFRREKADAATAKRLGVRSGTELYRHEKLTFANDEVVSLHILHVPKELALKLRAGLSQQFIFRLLKQESIDIANSRFEFASAGVDQKLAPIFHLPIGFPLLLVHYTPIDRNNSPLLTGVSICRADMFIFEVEVPAPPQRITSEDCYPSAGRS
jgi:DNA-binding GntR family transcriptional regulator